ncbi:hypothetical protein ACS8YF_19460 [Salinisphaera sp. SWV1]
MKFQADPSLLAPDWLVGALRVNGVLNFQVPPSLRLALAVNVGILNVKPFQPTVNALTSSFNGVAWAPLPKPSAKTMATDSAVRYLFGHFIECFSRSSS